jgi:hypothetical protein
VSGAWINLAKQNAMKQEQSTAGLINDDSPRSALPRHANLI